MSFVALLRGINLGAKNKVEMKSLKALFEDLGYENVRTYIQTGNVIFDNAVYDILHLEHTLRDTYGFDIPVTVRSKAELEELQQHPIFLKDQVYVMFLEKEISDEQQTLLDSLVDDDFVVWNRRNVIINLSNNYHQTKFTNAFFERKLGMASTARNRNTVNKIVMKM
ncbi:DUF1697 domain-containing protein [Psychrobacillus sp. NEAU-3TGS]|uniref:DUF1697 domain-containing protein n=1 Tax=Psychrobacillus sp. NEAU-3TGS TaxID=2995412 RepID=UPI002498EB2F|nr:DUF1697 domain-containing protein [Psychrobacillus sp. NEAU-3TGS]MDI2587325.1 DUF1697 domain-containing protein [Psychrobacillus sp. NEAU-3TGS]